MRRFLAALVLTGSALAQDIAVTEPRIVQGRAASATSIATNGDGFLVAGGRSLIWTASEIFVTQLLADGTPPRRPSKVLPGLFGFRPAVASNGENYLVVTGMRGGTTAILVDSSGSALGSAFVVHDIDRNPISISDTGETRRAVAWDGSRYVVVSRSEAINHGLIASTVDAAGRVLSSEIPLETLAYAGSVAAKNGVAVIAWRDGPSVLVRTLTAGVSLGAITEVVFDKPDNFESHIAVAAGDDGFLVVWNNGESIKARRLDPSGNLAGSVSTIATGVTGSGVAVTYHAGRYVVIWSGGRAELQAAGVTSEAFAVMASDRAAPSIASNGRVAVATYIAANTLVATSQRIDGPPFGIEFWIPDQVAPRAAYTASTYGVAWYEEAEERTIRFARISSDGRRLDGDGIVLSAAAPFSRVLTVGASANSFIVVWYANGEGRLYARRIRIDGTVIDSTPLLIDASYAFRGAQVFVDGDDFVVLWTDSQAPGDLSAMRLPGGGGAPSSPKVLTTHARGSVSVAFNGTKWLVVYSDDEARQLRGFFLIPQTLAVEGPEFTIAPIPSRFAVSALDGDFLVAWYGSGADIAVRRVSADGAMGNPIFLARGGADLGVRVVPYGAGYRVMWASQLEVSDIFTNREGSPLTPRRVLMKKKDMESWDVAYSPNRATSTLVFGSYETGVEAYRAFLRILEMRVRTVR